MSARPRTPALWPSLGEHFFYDDLLYLVMTSDERRNAAYRRALERSAPGSVVVDIGSGADGVLAAMAAEAGARRVYAIEQDADACAALRRTLAERGLEDRVHVVEGSSFDAVLPEPADVCVFELIGTVGSAEGAVPVLADARRLLRPGGRTIPSTCTTHVAAASLPEELRAAPRLAPLAAHYADELFLRAGGPFDVRVCLVDGTPEMLVSTIDAFERLSFPAPVQAPPATARLSIVRDAIVDGLLLWVRIGFEDELIDALFDDCPSWPPAFFPIFHPGVELAAGTQIELRPQVEYRALTPDYAIEGSIREAGGTRPFSYRSPCRSGAYRGSGFYRALFDAPADERAGAT